MTIQTRPRDTAVDLGAVNTYSREHKRDPFPLYARLRAEAPVCRLTAPIVGELWLITRYDDVAACLKDANRFVKDPRNAGVPDRKTVPRWMPASIKGLEENMLDVDDPGHRRLRALINQAFSRRRVDDMADRIDAIACGLLDRMTRGSTADMVETFALPLPLTVICELLGVPSADRHKFHKWSRRFLNATTDLKMLLSLPAAFAFISYLKKLFRARREEPRDDLITALVEAEEAGDRLSETELVAMVMLLIIAGHETTVNVIGSGTLALLEHPEQKQRLAKDPSLIDTAVEELLRFTAPVETATERYASENVELHGTRIRRGDLVIAAIASANRDESRFAEPDDLDLTRDPNPHLAFGDGVHFCVGHQLARMEARIAFTRLLERFPDMKLGAPVEALTWRETPVVRGLEALPVAV